MAELPVVLAGSLYANAALRESSGATLPPWAQEKKGATIPRLSATHDAHDAPAAAPVAVGVALLDESLPPYSIVPVG